MGHLYRFIRDRTGLATIEYALLLSLIGLIIAIAMSMLANAVGSQLDSKTQELNR